MPSDDRIEDYNSTDLHLGMMHSKYGLADGSRPPLGTIHLLTRKEILHALRETVSPMIPRNKAELRDIPLGFAKLPTVDAIPISDQSALASSGPRSLHQIRETAVQEELCRSVRKHDILGHPVRQRASLTQHIWQQVHVQVALAVR